MLNLNKQLWIQTGSWLSDSKNLNDPSESGPDSAFCILISLVYPGSGLKSEAESNPDSASES